MNSHQFVTCVSSKFAIRISSRSCTTILLYSLASSCLFAVQAPPVLNLPPTSDQITAAPVFTPSQSTYLSVALSGVPSNLSVSNGAYLGWCIDSFGTLETSTFTLYNSYGGVDGDPNPAVPLLDNLNGQTAWDEVNWLINHPGGNTNEVTANATEIQHVIWDLLDPYYASVFPISSQDANAQQLFSDAQTYGANFVPAPGQVVAVVLYADGIQPVTVNNVQDIFIEVAVPQPNEPPGGPDVYEINYFRNMNTGGPDDIVDIVDPGTNGAGNLCAMIYIVTPDEELNECCGCLITPDQLLEFGVQANLTGNPGPNGETAHNGAIKIIKSAPTNPAATGNAQCDPGAPIPTPTLKAWITHVATVSGVPLTTEVPFLYAPLSAAEQAFLAGPCAFYEKNFSGQGVCTCPTTLAPTTVPSKTTY